MHPVRHRVNTTDTLDATSAKPPSQTALGGSLHGFPNFRVFNTRFYSWGPRLDTGQYFRGVSTLFPILISDTFQLQVTNLVSLLCCFGIVSCQM